jgi:hypothetical protein
MININKFIFIHFAQTEHYIALINNVVNKKNIQILI